MTRLWIDGQVFTLTPGTNRVALGGEILAAVRSSAGFVDFDAESLGAVSVLLTPQTAVRFETFEASMDDGMSWEADNAAHRDVEWGHLLE